MGQVLFKECAAKKRERSKPGYDPRRVALNNIRRENWIEYPPQSFGDYDTADFDQWGDMDLGIHD